jgi:hypothetical protein
LYVQADKSYNPIVVSGITLFDISKSKIKLPAPFAGHIGRKYDNLVTQLAQL